MRYPIYLFALFALLGCNDIRLPGPSAEEAGLTFIWSTTDGLRTINEECPIAEWAEGFYLQPSSFFAPRSALIYILSEDGTTARLQDCSEEDCSPSPVAPLSVAGSTMTAVETSRIQVDSSTVADCFITQDRTFSIKDGGSELSFVIEDTFEWTGECAKAVQDQVADSTNGEDMGGCAVTYSWAATFLGTRDDSK